MAEVVAEKDGKEVKVDLGISDKPAAPEISEEGASGVLDTREMADAKKHGLIKAKPPAPAPAKPSDKKPDPAPKPAAKKEGEDPAPADPKEKKPEAVRADLFNENPDPLQEAKRIEGWSPNEKALYHERKKAVRRAQRAEAGMAERDKTIEDLRKQLSAAPKPDTGEPDADDPLNTGNKPPAKPAVPAAPKPVTEEEKRAAQEKRRGEIQGTLNEQESDFKVAHPDFDDVFASTTELMELVEKKDSAKLAELFPNPMELRGVKALIGEFETACAYADHPKLARQAPEIAYELGNLLRSKRQKPTAAEPAEPTPAEPATDPEKVGDEPPSSGSVSGGRNANPKRIIDITREEFVAMNGDKVQHLKDNFPKEFEALMRKLNAA